VRIADPTLRPTVAAEALSPRLHDHLKAFGDVYAPVSAKADRRFQGMLKTKRLHARARSALMAITVGEAARLFASGRSAQDFLEQVEYNGRRLAKFNLSPTEVTQLLGHYESFLHAAGNRIKGWRGQELRWVGEQLHFAVILTLNNAFYQVRESETEVFYEMYRAEAESGDLDQMLQRFLGTLLRFSRAEEAHLWLWSESEGRWLRHASARFSGEPAQPGAARDVKAGRRPALLMQPRSVGGKTLARVALDPDWPIRFQHCWSVPMASEGKLYGVIQFAFSKPYEWFPREQALLEGAAERCLLAAERSRLIQDLAEREEQIRLLAGHMLQVEEIERQRISRELHDEAGQSLLCIRLGLEVLEEDCPPEARSLRQRLTHLREVAEKTIIEIRRLIRALSPAVLEQFGLEAALRQLVTQFHQVHPARVRLHVGRLAPLPKQMEIVVYRLVQECFNNIAKHSSATAVNVFLHSADGVLRLQVEDDGVGFQVAPAFQKKNSFGLAGMRERVALLGGSFHLVSHPAGAVGKGPQGTRILIELPVPQEGAGEGKLQAAEA